MRRYFALLMILCCMFPDAMLAQELTVKGMQATNDLSASQQRRQDLNGEPCALVKVQLAATDVTFEGNVIPPVEYKGGEYWVYLTQGSKELRIKHQAVPPTFLPCHVKFTDYGIKDIQSLTTYYLTLLLPPAASPMESPYASQPVAQPVKQGPVVADSSAIETITVNGVSFIMVRVDGGTFMMGATEEQSNDAESDEKPAHQVKLSTYSIGETEVTQELWQAVMGENPSDFKGNQRPVEQVSWGDCQDFIKKLNQLTGRKFRLPTEAEWEYAARGGSKSQHHKYSGGDNINDVAWYDKNAWNKGSTHPDYGTHVVKTKQANELGLYDMSGNVWEWCQDWFGGYSRDKQTNPQGSQNGSYRVRRGGSWYHDSNVSRTSFRFNGSPSARLSYLGLRLAL